MSTTFRKTVAVVAAVAFAVAGVAYWYWSPLIALHELQTAAQARDTDAFNRHVDYAKLRDSLKSQLGAKVADAMGDGSAGANAGAALGTMLGMAIADRMIEVLVRPEVVMMAMSDGVLSEAAGHAAGAVGAGAGAGAGEPKRPAVEWTLDHEGVDRVVAYASIPGKGAAGGATGFVFDRDGFAGWKLTGVRLPQGK
ncbi:MAG: DUF2939 domain-containing protein [Proteobacteria bacterium]|nr:DUF2939 domain-containing protein [Pseudomonadota bacterium]